MSIICHIYYLQVLSYAIADLVIRDVKKRQKQLKIRGDQSKCDSEISVIKRKFGMKNKLVINFFLLKPNDYITHTPFDHNTYEIRLGKVAIKQGILFECMHHGRVE